MDPLNIKDCVFRTDMTFVINTLPLFSQVVLVNYRIYFPYEKIKTLSIVDSQRF